MPLFYAMPKVHKTPMPNCPVINYINSFNAIFSTWLDFQMKSFLSYVPSYLFNSSTLIKEIKQLNKLPTNA